MTTSSKRLHIDRLIEMRDSDDGLCEGWIKLAIGELIERRGSEKLRLGEHARELDEAYENGVQAGREGVIRTLLEHSAGAWTNGRDDEARLLRDLANELSSHA